MSHFEEHHPLKPLIAGWIGKLERAREHKARFQKIADECMEYFAPADSAFMWKDDFRFKFTDSKQGSLKPQFMLSLNKAFELVALIGPVLYNRNPVRTVTPRAALEFPPELFGDPNSPQVQQFVQQIQQQEQQEAVQDKTRAMLLERWLNYTPNEMPNGGLSEHSSLAITEALIKGRGVLWTEPYTFPGSDMVMPISTFESQDNLLLDPDGETMAFDSTKWIARRKVMTTWQVEKEFKRPKGSLKGKGTLESAESQGERKGSAIGNLDREHGEANDLMEVWYIYSAAGIGARLTDLEDGLSKAMDDVVGDFAFLAIAAGVPYPLNFHGTQISRNRDGSIAKDEDVRKAFRWPIPFYKDARWPCSILDFYPKPRSTYPVSPLSPGLGPLKAINIILSALTGQVFESTRTLISVLKRAGKELKKTLQEGKHLDLLEIDESLGTKVSDVVQMLQFPPANFDVWRILDALMEVFEKATGLSEFLYGGNPGPNGAASRTAEDASNKRTSASIRPDHMAARVEQWQTEVSRREALCARWFVEEKDVEHLLGTMGAKLWGQLLLDTDPDKVVRELEYRIEAGSARKPNKDRDVANFNQAMQYWMPIFEAHANATGDTNPINTMIKLFGKTADMDVSGLQLGPRVPPPPPEGTPDPAQMEMQAKQQELQMKMQEMQFKQQMEEKKLQVELMKVQAMIASESQKADIAMQIDAQKAQLEASIAERQFKFDAFREAAEHQQEMQQDQQTHIQELLQGRQMGLAKIEQIRATGRAQSQAAAKRKTQTSGAAA